MNNSNLFSTDQFPVWNLEVTKQILCIPEDQLNILNAIPGWNEVQRQCNTLRIEKDFSSNNSQFLNSVYNSQNNKLFSQHNLDLFEKDKEERKNILKKKSQRYSEKLSRSISSLCLDNIEVNLLSDRSLKRVSSLPTILELPDIVIEDKDYFSSKANTLSIIYRKELPILRQVESSTIFKAKKVLVEPEISEKLFCSSEIDAKVMEVETHLPVNISSHVLKPAAQASNSEVISKKDDSLPVKTKEMCSNNFKSDPLNVVFHLTQDPMHTENETAISQNKSNPEPTSLESQSHSNIGNAHEINCDAPVENNIVPAKKHIKDIQHLEDKFDGMNSKDRDLCKENINQMPEISMVPVLNESKNQNLHTNGEKIAVAVGSETVTDNPLIHELQNPNKKSVESIQVPEERKTDTVESVALDKPQMDSTFKIDDGKNNAKENFEREDNKAVTNVENLGKRKSDFKNRRSKKLKSEDTKRGKIRNLKNVEVHYRVEEIQIMLDILKQFY